MFIYMNCMYYLLQNIRRKEKLLINKSIDIVDSSANGKDNSDKGNIFLIIRHYIMENYNNFLKYKILEKIREGFTIIYSKFCISSRKNIPMIAAPSVNNWSQARNTDAVPLHARRPIDFYTFSVLT